MDYTEADEIAAAMADAATELAQAFHADTVQIQRGTTRVPDGAGGYTEAPNTIATVRGRLDVDQRIGAERDAGGRLVAISTYTVELPKDTDVRASDSLVVNGRTFAITDVKRGGEQDLFLTLGVEAQS